MNILPPRVMGPLSECSRSVIVSNVFIGATVTLIVMRNGADRQVGKKVVTGFRDVIPLDSAEELKAGDLVNAVQILAPGSESPQSTDGPQVQNSVAQFNYPQLLSRLYQCSHGFSVGGVRPGIQLQVLQGGLVIGTGEATDGTAFISIPRGLPGPVTSTPLVVRQLICPKPPTTPPATLYQVDSQLPQTLFFPYRRGQTVPAPKIAEGLTACSRAVKVEGIVPGAQVFLEAVSGAWWASLNESDQTSRWISLPVQLREGEEVSIRQEAGMRCELLFEKKTMHVGPAQQLTKLFLALIECNTVSTIYVWGQKTGADLEFSVTVDGVETLFRTIATEFNEPLPAPPMPPGAQVKIRQGECEIWSEWSNMETAKPLAVPPQQPKINIELFSCQDAIFVENVLPLNGILKVMSRKFGELNRVSAGHNTPTISVAPSFLAGDEIWIEHHVCGQVAKSEPKTVKERHDVVRGQVKGPLYDGDSKIHVLQVTAGARIELWEETKNQLLESGRTPFASTEHVNMVFSGFGKLQAGWKIYAKTLHCGSFVQTQPSEPVIFRAPVIDSITPVSAIAGEPGFTLTVKGHNFITGAKVQWNAADRVTTFISGTELKAVIPQPDIATVKTVPVRVVNPDGQLSGPINFQVSPVPPPPVVGYDELVIQNCSIGFIPGSDIHRRIHIFARRTDIPGDVWGPINASPHEADYNENGTCPAGPNVGARFALDDGAIYEVVCTDPYRNGCMTGKPDELTCRCSIVFVVHGKTGGGVKTVIVN
jgi:hypothetical protein